ncbi:MAG: hypothetical protein IT289_00600 [Oligoflexia bacterium]|nr:hypothetical protein [Oligoflexia bacterium]
MRWKAWIAVILIVFVLGFIGLYIWAPNVVAWVFSYKRECRVARVESFSKGFVVTNKQLNKFSVVCDDGSVCRADDSGFAGVKPGDLIVFRGFPEISSLQEFGKCDHAQLIKIKETAPSTP